MFTLNLGLSPYIRGRSEVFRGLARCQAVPSEGSAVPCTTVDPQGAKRRGYYLQQVHTTSPSARRKAFGLLGGDKSPVVATDAEY